MRIALAFGFFILGSAAGTCNVADRSLNPQVQISIIDGRPIVSGVFLNGRGPYRFLIDTGATTNQVDAVLARKLSLTPTFRVELVTAAGSTLVAGTRVDEVALGRARAVHQEFLFTTLEAVRTLSPGIQGVLGQEFLSRFDYLIDLRARTLLFNPQEPGGLHTSFESIDRRPTLQTSLGRLVLDSGTSALLLFRQSRAAEPAAAIRTASGFAAARAAAPPRITIAGRQYKPESAAIVDHPGLSEDGLLPLCLFNGIYVCNSGGYVIVDPAR